MRILLTSSLVLSSLFILSSCRPDQEATEYKVTENPIKSNTDSPDDAQDNTPVVDVPEIEEPKETDLDDVISSCDKAKLDNSLLSQEIVVNFPAAIECNFNENGILVSDLNAEGNGPRLNMRIRARKEQYFKAQLPQASTICDIDFNFPEQKMQYDDEIFLTLNNYVIMASTNYSTESGSSYYKNGLLINSLGLMEYKWSGANGLYDLYYNHNVTPDYCLGLNKNSPDYATKCHIPPTETNGQFKLDIPSNEIVKLGLSSSGDEVDFGFITTGDNDNGDCEHSAYSFNISVKYIN